MAISRVHLRTVWVLMFLSLTLSLDVFLLSLHFKVLTGLQGSLIVGHSFH